MRSARKVNMHQGRSRYHPLLRRLTTPLQLAFIFLERLHPQNKLLPLLSAHWRISYGLICPLGALTPMLERLQLTALFAINSSPSPPNWRANDPA